MSKDQIFLLILLSLAISAASKQAEFLYSGFFPGAGNDRSGGGGFTPENISLRGAAEIEGRSGIVRLTDGTNRILGRAFYPKPLRFKSSADGAVSSFSTVFAFAIVSEYPKIGGHGMAFTIAPSMDLPGAYPIQYLGLMKPSDVGNASNHIFAVEFDTVQDFEFGDINDNHVGIDLNSLVSNSSSAVAYYADGGAKKDLYLKCGHTVLAWVDYDGAAKLLNVTVAPFSDKPATPLLSFPVDLSPILLDNMYVGFSASTGLLASSHYLLGWSFKLGGGATMPLDLSSLPRLPQPSKKNTALIVAVSFSALLVLVAAIAAGSYLLYKILNADVIEPWELTCGPHRFSYKELKRATNGFRDQELLGFGGFGKVYKGTLPGSRVEVAVKRVSQQSRQGIREFVAEIASIGRLRHRNLVQLQGWCRRHGDLLLVYDYMPNGSLDKFLFSPDGTAAAAEEEEERRRPLLSWPERIRILRGVASALLYLHEEWEHVVIHRDVKASNVLLDGNLNGRLGDFGLAKLYDHGDNPATTRVVGTLGYLAPELTRTGKATTSSDVYAFGAVVLEVVCGRRPVEPKAMPEELVLVDWVWERWSAGSWAEIVDSRLAGSYNREEAEAIIKVGLWCSHPSPVARPGMREVVRYLEGGDPSEVPDVTSLSADDATDGKRLAAFAGYGHSLTSWAGGRGSTCPVPSGNVATGSTFPPISSQSNSNA